MALTDEGGGIPATMLVGPTGYGNNGFGGFGGDGWWIILLLLAFSGGWGFGGFGGAGAMMGMDGFGLYPWLNNSQNINDGFRDQMLQTTVTGISDKLCGGFADVNAAITGASMANMQSLFGVQSALQQAACDNRAGIADVKYTIATEACATRSANAANTQAVLDKLCQLELDGYKRENDQLRSQLQFANMQASQVAQTAELKTAQAVTANNLVTELRSCPIPAQPVYGNTPIFSCGGTSCGCGA